MKKKTVWPGWEMSLRIDVFFFVVFVFSVVICSMFYTLPIVCWYVCVCVSDYVHTCKKAFIWVLQPCIHMYAWWRTLWWVCHFVVLLKILLFILLNMFSHLCKIIKHWKQQQKQQHLQVPASKHILVYVYYNIPCNT